MLTDDDKAFLIDTAKETAEDIESKATPLFNSISKISSNDFNEFHDLFESIAIIFEEFGFKTMAKHTKSMQRLCHYCMNLENPKAHQKSLFLIKDFGLMLDGFTAIFSDKKALVAIRRKFDVQNVKVERLFWESFIQCIKLKNQIKICLSQRASSF
ncbi:hypothetical protein OAT67_02700 [Bacteriovoracaceae bacterium]|nr:hypothetical protein [Bacteriovoracaceae bacterium]